MNAEKNRFVRHSEGERGDQGLVFDVQRFSVDDGPGIRTTVFLKGCPLRCLWCHNPESQHAVPEILFNAEQCLGCGKCLEICPYGAIQADPAGRIQRDRCAVCGLCVQNCPSGALSIAGVTMSLTEVLAVIRRDLIFYQNSCGGIAASGGEPLVQSGFVAAMLKDAKKLGLHTTVDTSGYASWRDFEQVLPYTDLFLYDLKQMDPDEHQRITGVSNERILENLIRLDEAGASVCVRFPVIPRHTDQPANIEKMGQFLLGLKHRPSIEPLAYHELGSGKYEKLGRAYACRGVKPPGNGQMEAIRRHFRELGFEVIVNGSKNSESTGKPEFGGWIG